MKALFLSIFLLFQFHLSFSQDKNGTNDSIRKFSVIDKVPVYKGCEEFEENEALKRCMSLKISQLITEEFDVKKAYKLGVAVGHHKIDVSFKINNKGKITNILAFSESYFLEEEAERVLGLIEIVSPGMKFGKGITISYSIPIEVFISKPK